MVTLQLQQLDIPVGQRLRLHDINWDEFEAILMELGEHRASRVAYHQGILEIRMPTPEHEVDKELIGDLIKILLDELEIDCECFGSTPFKQTTMGSGIEPDQCFYIQNHLQMRGKRRVNLNVDPPPDLALEVDVTSKTQLDAYMALGVMELWIYDDGELKLYVLRSNQYEPVRLSPTFSELPIPSLVQELLEDSREKGRRAALKALRQKIQST